MTKAGLGFILGFREKKMKVKGVFWGLGCIGVILIRD